MSPPLYDEYLLLPSVVMFRGVPAGGQLDHHHNKIGRILRADQKSDGCLLSAGEHQIVSGHLIVINVFHLGLLLTDLCLEETEDEFRDHSLSGSPFSSIHLYTFLSPSSVYTLGQ